MQFTYAIFIEQKRNSNIIFSYSNWSIFLPPYVTITYIIEMLIAKISYRLNFIALPGYLRYMACVGYIFLGVLYILFKIDKCQNIAKKASSWIIHARQFQGQLIRINAIFTELISSG